MALIAIAGACIREGRGFDFRLPPEIRAMADVPEQTVQWRVHECLLDLSHEMTFADGCVERDRRPLVLIWGDSTAGALMPGLRKAQQTRHFGIAQFTSSSCIPALHVDVEGTPNCRAINDHVLALVREIQPDIVLLHGTWDRYLDDVAETVAALKQQTSARVVVLGAVPFWQRGLPNEVLRHFMLYHSLIPRPRTRRSAIAPPSKRCATKSFRSALNSSPPKTRCATRDGCLTRLGEAASDISTSDQVHLTEQGSEFLIGAIIDRVLGGPPAPVSNKPR